MATATLARSEDGVDVVLKRPIQSDDDLARRMRDEARVGARVQHPNLVETLDLFEHEGKPVLVVGFVNGVAVQDLRKAGRVTTAAVARVGWQIASCLHALHTATDENNKPSS
jgi:serine/threonine-protein kinase